MSQITSAGDINDTASGKVGTVSATTVLLEAIGISVSGSSTSEYLFFNILIIVKILNFDGIDKGINKRHKTTPQSIRKVILGNLCSSSLRITTMTRIMIPVEKLIFNRLILIPLIPDC